MKTFGAFRLLTLIGLTCGVMITVLDTAFEPKHCGEDCLNAALASLFTWLPIYLVFFPSIGLFAWSQVNRTWKNMLFICLVLVFITTLSAIGLYLYRADHQAF